MESLFSQADPVGSHQAPLHNPKIKPLLRRYPRETPINETNYQKSLKTHSKTFKATKTITNKGRNSLPRYIKGYVSHLKEQDSLSKLFYSVNSTASFENVYLFSKIREFSKINSLGIECWTNKFYQIPLRVLFKSLVYLKDLAHFKLEFNFYLFSDPPILRLLFRSLRSLKKLKSLSLSFRNTSNLWRAEMKNFSYNLGRLKQLESLTLNFDGPKQLTEQNILSLASTLPKLPILIQISLGFSWQMYQLRDSTLVKILQNMKNQTEITLNLCGSNVMKGEYNCPLSEGLVQLEAPSVKKLSLCLYKNLNAENLIRFSEILTRFTSLRTFHLDFTDCSFLSNNTAAALSLALSSLKTLSSLSLILNGIEVADSTIGSIASALKSLPDLVNLKVSVARNLKGDMHQIQELSESIATLINLQFLDLSFNTLNCLSDDILEKFGESLKRMVHLKNLALDFTNAKVVTNKGVELIMNSIQELRGLSSLDLNFGANIQVDKKAVESISSALKCLPSLYATSLKLSQCLKLQQKEKSLSSLFDALRNTENIREISLVVAKDKENEQEIDKLLQKKFVTCRWSS